MWDHINFCCQSGMLRKINTMFIKSFNGHKFETISKDIKRKCIRDYIKAQESKYVDNLRSFRRDIQILKDSKLRLGAKMSFVIAKNCVLSRRLEIEMLLVVETVDLAFSHKAIACFHSHESAVHKQHHEETNLKRTVTLKPTEKQKKVKESRNSILVTVKASKFNKQKTFKPAKASTEHGHVEGGHEHSHS